MLYVDVILPVPLDGLFTYSVPTELEDKVQPYVRVVVPFGITKTHIALVVRVHRDAPDSDIKIKPIISVLDASPVLLPQQYKLWQWISNYYMCPLGDVLVAALPQGMKKTDSYRPKMETYIHIGANCQNERSIHNALDMLCRSPKQLEVFTTYLQLSGLDSLQFTVYSSQFTVKEVTREELINASHATTPIVKALVDKGFLMLYDKEVGRLNTEGEPHPERIKPLSEAQQKAFEQLSLSTVNGKPSTVNGLSLLHGVTSSGKTEIYIHLIQEAIDRGEQVMYLLPEIALTVQMTQRLQHVFGNRLGIYHSKYSDAERVEIWQKQLSSEPYDVILGARSAVFLPYQRLGLVIIDEEHETSFKQQDPAPRYHARSVAMMMAQWAKARVVLGTATPSAESYYNAMQGKYRLVELKQRYKDLQLPKITVVNTKDLYRRKIMRGILSPQLEQAIREALGRGEQAIVFQNRRGFSLIVECHQCGWSPRCPHCDVALTHHKTTNTLTCHYCGYTMRMPQVCPECGNADLYNRGAGTEKVEDIIAATFPNARVARMDLDTTRTRNAYERIIAEFSSGKTNLLIGTQMVTKGLDFDNVSVVGILSADTMLNQPDFHAYEHAFMMMTQVAGRAGRKGRRGQVILQTSRPDLPVISHIVNNNFEAFFRSLMKERKAFRYPPFARLIYIYLKHKDESLVNSAAIELGSRLRQSFADRVLGPDKPSVSRIKSLYIRKLVLKLETNLSISATRAAIRQAVAAMMQDARYKSLLVYYDVDPV
ncbi:MAG: primosomal protein N' [Prevotella sp.]|nr:primosomal protein N' [Prevotella sp.]